MNAYVRGSLALEERRPAAPAREAQPGAEPAARARTMPGTDKLLWIAIALLTFTVLGFYQYREAYKYEMNVKMIRIEKEIRALEEKNAALRNEVSKLASPERLIEKGILLGLAPPAEWPAAPAGGGIAVASAR